jgi:hypothetical protein
MKIRFRAHLNQEPDQLHVAGFLGRRLEIRDSQGEQPISIASGDQPSVLRDGGIITLFYERPKVRRFSITFLARVKLAPPPVDARGTLFRQPVRLLAASVEGGIIQYAFAFLTLLLHRLDPRKTPAISSQRVDERQVSPA